MQTHKYGLPNLYAPTLERRTDGTSTLSVLMREQLTPTFLTQVFWLYVTDTGCSPHSKTANSACRRRASLVRAYICNKAEKIDFIQQNSRSKEGTNILTHTNTRGYLHRQAALRLAIRVCVPFGWTFSFWVGVMRKFICSGNRV